QHHGISRICLQPFHCNFNRVIGIVMEQSAQDFLLKADFRIRTLKTRPVDRNEWYRRKWRYGRYRGDGLADGERIGCGRRDGSLSSQKDSLRSRRGVIGQLKPKFLHFIQTVGFWILVWKSIDAGQGLGSFPDLGESPDKVVFGAIRDWILWKPANHFAKLVLRIRVTKFVIKRHAGVVNVASLIRR